MTSILSTHTIGVIGSGSDEHLQSATEVGQLLASLGVNLLTGGGGGVMRSVARAYTASPRSAGISIGIIPCADIDHRDRAKSGYPNDTVELPIYTHLPYSGSRGKDDLSRNHINVLSCLAIIALPGGEGTAAEIALAVEYRKPVIGYGWTDDPPTHIEQGTTIQEVEAFVRLVMDKGGENE